MLRSKLAPSSRSTARRRPPSKRGSLAAEVLEQRVLLTYADDFGDIYTADAEYDSQVIGRMSDGGWWTSQFQLSDPYKPGFNATFAGWSTAVDWRFVGAGDFDGDGLDDIAGWDPATGAWWVSLSDGVGSTTTLAGTWSTATTWADVRIADANADGLDDIIGRAASGAWYAGLSDGAGRFYNIPLVNWDPNGGWRDVFVADVDQNGLNDLVGRSAAGVWQVSYAFAFTNLTVTAGQWDESQGWQDAMITKWRHNDGSNFEKITIVARSSTGVWQGLVFNPDRTASTVVLGAWNEAANWRDVMIADVDRGMPRIVGRTDYGEWWSSSLIAGQLASQALGTWNESAGWNDVYFKNVADAGDDYLIGRTDDGAWWATRFDSFEFFSRLVGVWNPNAGWQDVTHGNFTRSPINTHTEIVMEANPIGGPGAPRFIPVEYRSFVIYAHRNGAEARIQESTQTSKGGYLVTYSVPSTGYQTSRFFPFPTPTRQTATRFFGRNGNDTFINSTRISSQGWGLGGADIFDGRNGVFDEFFGGAGVDILLGDAGDKLVQD